MGTDLLIVVSDFGSGGSQRAISLISNHWAKMGKSVKIITFSDVNKDFYKLNNNVQVLFHPNIYQSINNHYFLQNN